MTDRPDKNPWDPTRKLDVEVRGDLVKRTLFFPKVNREQILKQEAKEAKDAKDAEDAVDKEVTETDRNATNLRDFAEHWLNVGCDRFVEENPYHFLIQESMLTRSTSSGYFTMAGGGTKEASPVELFSAMLYRLVKKTKGSFPHMITVGRANNNDVFIKDPLISKFHAYFMKRGSDWYVADSGSTNGTFVDNKPLEATVPRKLEVDSIISFSEDLSYRFVDNEKVLGYLLFFQSQRDFDAG
ncbi:MAG: FHA domain-containing protein [Planctomycetota bacterium]|nr:FHA domain-containing protein [Planctomycetota bacterium]